MLPLCRDQGVGVIPYSPLASGRLTRDWASETTLRSETDQIQKMKYDATVEADKKVVERVAELAERRGASRTHIALAWLLTRKPWIVPIPGTTKLHRLHENLGAAAVKLTAADLQEIESAASKIAIQGARYSEAAQKMINR